MKSSKTGLYMEDFIVDFFQISSANFEMFFLGGKLKTRL